MNEEKEIKKQKEKAENILNDNSRLVELLKKAVKKSKNRSKELKDDIVTSVQLIKDWKNNEYKNVSKKTIVTLLAGIIYFVNPFDLIPDFLMHFGFIDDIGVMTFIMGQFKTEIDNYRLYKEGKGMDNEILDKYKGSMVGLAVGDALGSTLEFMEKDDLEEGYVHSEIIGKGKLNLAKGEWTDDTSMALCLAQSLIEQKGFDANDQMEKYTKWYENGYMSPNSKCVDIGMGTLRALGTYKRTQDPYSFNDTESLGNGSIMRLAPVTLYFHPDLNAALNYAEESSKPTHPGDLCLQSCRALSLIIFKAIEGESKDSILNIENPEEFGITDFEIINLLKGGYKEKAEDEINNSGFVLTTLEAALWCFYHTDDFESALIKAVNLCGDADTIGAVCGQIAGAYYGYNAIPERWLESILKRELIEEKALQMYQS